MGKPPVIDLQSKQELSFQQNQEAVLSAQDVYFEAKGKRFWLAFDAGKIKRKDVTHMLTIAPLRRLEAAGIGQDDVYNDDGTVKRPRELRAALSLEQYEAFLAANQGNWEDEVRTYAPGITDWNVADPNAKGDKEQYAPFDVETFLGKEDDPIYRAALAAAVEAFFPTSEPATEANQTTPTPS